MRAKKVNLYGASGHAKVIMDIIHSRNDIELGYLFDDNEALVSLLGVPINAPAKKELLESHPIIIAIGNNKIRREVVFKYGSYVSDLIAHGSAVISPSASIGEGTVVMAQAAVNADAIVGKYAIINTAAIVEHDCSLGDYVHVSPKAALAGNVQVGEGTHIGTGAVVIPGVRIGKWSTIGAGAVIIQDVPDGVTVVGNPGKILT